MEKETITETDTSFMRSELFYPILLMSLLFNMVIGGQAFNVFSPLAASFIEKSDEDFSNLDPIFELTNMIGQKLLSGKQIDIFRNERGERNTTPTLRKKSGKTPIDEVESDPIQTLYNLSKKKRKKFKKFFKNRESLNARDR